MAFFRKAVGNIYTTLGVMKSVDIVFNKNKTMELKHNFLELAHDMEGLQTFKKFIIIKFLHFERNWFCLQTPRLYAAS